MYLSVMATDNIILEHLRAIRGQLDRLETRVDEIYGQVVSARIREHARDGDDIRRDQAIATLQADMDRVKRRLDLVSGDET